MLLYATTTNLSFFLVLTKMHGIMKLGSNASLHAKFDGI